MKVQEHANTLETNVESESKEFGIGDASVVIEILRNRLYENKIQTCVQEYICNARDAMREVGKNNTFEVTVPTRLSPTFKVKDFGPGISPDRMDKVFRLYGASTKRGSNNQTGGFGIGAKSAWSYTDSFTVVTVVDGTRRTYVCHTGTNNQGSLDLISTDSTDECNGTEIQIAVQRQDLNEFHNAVLRAIYFWSQRPVVKGIDGELPKLCGGYHISDNIETIDRNAVPSFIGLDYYAKALAVIDGVPYPVTEKLLKKADQLGKFLESSLRKSVILHFGNGLVEVSASRESIADSPRTITALNKMGTKGGEVVEKHIKDAFAKVNSVATWTQTYKDLMPYFEVDKHSKYGDYSIEDGAIVGDPFKLISMTLAHGLDKRGRYTVDRISKEELTRDRERRIPMDMIGRVFLVTKEETKVVQNKRLREFFHGKPAQLQKVILLQYSGDPANVDKVVADFGIKPFETSLTYVDTPKEPKEKVLRENTEICLHAFSGTRYKYTTLAKNTSKYLYVEVKDGSFEGFHQRDLSDLSWHLRDHYNGLQVVGIADRGAKMVKGDPNFTPLKEWLAAFTPTKAHVNYAISERIKNGETIQAIIGLAGIKDQFLVDMAKEYDGILSGRRKLQSIPSLLIDKVKEESSAKVFFENDEKLTALLDTKYPLIKEIGKHTQYKNELAFYINAKYTN